MTSDVTRRDFGGFLISGAAAAGLNTSVTSAKAQQTAAIEWTSDNPHLGGNFAPVGTELDATDLPVIAGRIPADLSGAYMRNGPNPLFKPISFTYPLDGDGMIHAVYLDNGRARYRNRFVCTRGLAAERRAGHAIYGGLMRPIPVDPALVGADGDPGPFKNGAFISVLRHGGHLLALSEAMTSYEMTMDLDTIGEWKAGTDKPIRLGAHNRRHPRTGALFALAYSALRPVVEFHQIDAAGNLVKTFPVNLAALAMIHDFVLTERYIVLLVCPAVFDLAAAKAGQSMLQWRPGLGTRIGIIPIDDGPTVWLDADPFFVFHFANGFERGGHILIDYVRHDSLALGYVSAGQKAPTLHRMNIDLANRAIADLQISDMVTEFPRINDRLDALPTRFVFLPTLTDTLKLPRPPSATFNAMVKADTESGDLVRHDFGNRIAGEAVFVPRADSRGEDDGYLAVFAFDPVNQASDFILLDAVRIDADPAAVVRLPQRIPQGLHGTWIPNA
jgi:carotenoid cleavage dioxygenase